MGFWAGWQQEMKFLETELAVPLISSAGAGYV